MDHLVLTSALTRAVKQHSGKLNRKTSSLCTVEIHFVQPAMSTHRTCSFLFSEECGGAGRRVHRVREVAKERSLCCIVYQSGVTDTAIVTR